MKTKSLLLASALLMSASTFAQKNIFKGVVLDDQGEPVIGATIQVKGNRGTGTITDLDGNFSIETDASQPLVITYVGYQNVEVKPSANMRITLKQDDKTLDEVVVVGYGTQKKAHLTGAIATVPMDDIQDLASGNLASTLSGMVNGLSVSGGDARPGENARINIRQNDVLSDI